MTLNIILKEINHLTYNKWKKELKKTDYKMLVNSLEKTFSGTKYHPELSTLKHIFLICKALKLINREDLLEIAFIHDLGKINIKNIGKDRIYNFGHENISIEYINNYFNKLSEFENWQLLTFITHYHMKYNKDSIRSKTKALNYIENNYYPMTNEVKDEWIDALEDFQYCDKFLSRKLYNIYFSLFDEIKNKLIEKYLFYKQRYSRKQLHIMIGISGSGKSTFIKNNFLKEHIVCPDDIRVELTGNINNQNRNDDVWAITEKRLKEKLKKYNKAVLDATNINFIYRLKLMTKFNGVKKIAYIFNIELEEAIKRVNEDIENNVTRANVSEKVIRRQYKLFKESTKKNRIIHEFNKIYFID